MDRYSKQGLAPRLPSCMLRSYLLSIKFKVSSITRWYGFYFFKAPSVLSATPYKPFPCLFFHLYHKQFLLKSVEYGLINPAKLSLAGDGTPLRTSSLLRKKRICTCKDNGISDCNCKRLFSQPDTNSGWDSSRECYLMDTTFSCLLLPIPLATFPISIWKNFSWTLPWMLSLSMSTVRQKESNPLLWYDIKNSYFFIFFIILCIYTIFNIIFIFLVIDLLFQ